MFPRNILTKLARSRLQGSLVTRTFKTSSPLWRDNREGPDKSKPCEQPAGRKIEDDPTKLPKECDTKKQLKITKHCPSESDKYAEPMEQGEISSCGPIEVSNKGLEEKSQRTGKPPDFEKNVCFREEESNRYPTSSGCSCPPFNTPKIVEERDAKKEQKHASTKRCPEDRSQQRSREEDKYVSEQIRVNPCERVKPKCAQEKNQCGNGMQERSEPCCSTNLSRNNICPQENECSNSYKQTRNDCCETMTASHSTCSDHKNDCEVQSDACGQTKTSVQKPCPENCAQQRSREEDNCVSDQIRVNPCESVKPKCAQEKSQCGNGMQGGSEPCCSTNLSRKNMCPQENECSNNYKQTRNDCCETMTSSHRTCSDKKNDCEVQSDACGKTKASTCPEEDKCANLGEQFKCEEIKIPELSPCCKVDAAKECISKLKNLQQNWEEVIKAQEHKGKDGCPNSQELGATGHQDRWGSKTKKSNMIYVVLVGIMATVLYYTYNSDFEHDEIFLDHKELEENVEDDMDDD